MLKCDMRVWIIWEVPGIKYYCPSSRHQYGMVKYSKLSKTSIGCLREHNTFEILYEDFTIAELENALKYESDSATKTEKHNSERLDWVGQLLFSDVMETVLTRNLSISPTALNMFKNLDALCLFRSRMLRNTLPQYGFTKTVPKNSIFT